MPCKLVCVFKINVYKLMGEGVWTPPLLSVILCEEPLIMNAMWANFWLLQMAMTLSRNLYAPFRGNQPVLLLKLKVVVSMGAPPSEIFKHSEI